MEPIPMNTPPPHSSISPRSCKSMCSCELLLEHNGGIPDIEESTPPTASSILKKRMVSNSANLDGTKVTIEHSSNRPLSHSLNTITQSLKNFTEALPNESQSASDILFNSFDNDKLASSNIKIPLCTCQQSKAYPYCDSTHKQFNQETNSNLTPIYIKFEKQQNDNSNTTSNQKQTRQLRQSTNIKNLNNSNSNTLTSSQQQQPQQQLVQSIEKDSLIKEQQQQQQQQDIEQEVKIQSLPKYTPTSLKDPLNQNNHFSLEEISKHCTIDDCWMIIQNKVYDITTYIDRHPGGKRALIRFAGKDGTENVQFHSKTMLQLLNNHYFIGHLRKDQQAVEPSRCSII